MGLVNQKGLNKDYVAFLLLCVCHCYEISFKQWAAILDLNEGLWGEDFEGSINHLFKNNTSCLTLVQVKKGRNDSVNAYYGCVMTESDEA